jgi:hypothetical protein
MDERQVKPISPEESLILGGFTSSRVDDKGQQRYCCGKAYAMEALWLPHGVATDGKNTQCKAAFLKPRQHAGEYRKRFSRHGHRRYRALSGTFSIVCNKACGRIAYAFCKHFAQRQRSR